MLFGKKMWKENLRKLGRNKLKKKLNDKRNREIKNLKKRKCLKNHNIKGLSKLGKNASKPTSKPKAETLKNQEKVLFLLFSSIQT